MKKLLFVSLVVFSAGLISCDPKSSKTEAQEETVDTLVTDTVAVDTVISPIDSLQADTTLFE